MNINSLVELFVSPLGLVVSSVIVTWSVSLSCFIRWCVKAPDWTADEGFRTCIAPSKKIKQTINTHYLGEGIRSTPLKTSGDQSE